MISDFDEHWIMYQDMLYQGGIVSHNVTGTGQGVSIREIKYRDGTVVTIGYDINGTQIFRSEK